MQFIICCTARCALSIAIILTSFPCLPDRSFGEPAELLVYNMYLNIA